MGFRYRKSLRLSRGTRANFTGHGLSSLSFGKRGSTLNFGRRGVRGTVGIPGSGLSYSSRLGSSPALLLGIFIALFAGLVTLALRGNRLAQGTIVVIAAGFLALLLVQPRPPPGAMVSNIEQPKAVPILPGGTGVDSSRPQSPSHGDLDRVTGSIHAGRSLGHPSDIGNSSQLESSAPERIPPPASPTGSAELTQPLPKQGALQIDLSNSKDALRVQKRLKSLGYAVGLPDGIWGFQSQTALDNFRRAHTLSTASRWDQETQLALFPDMETSGGSDLEVGDDRHLSHAPDQNGHPKR